MIALILTGVGASIIGSVVGLGGGFITVPVLRLGFHYAPGAAAAASLVLVFANSVSASVRFAMQKRIAFDLAVPIAIAAIPGSVIGALLSARTTGQTYDVLYAIFLSAIAIDVLRRTFQKRPAIENETPVLPTPEPAWWIFSIVGFVVGLVSSLFGIGGGVIVVPILLYTTKKDLHIITATSTAVIAMTAPVGIVVQGFEHDLAWNSALALGGGGLIGGQIGAILSQRISSVQLTILLAMAMMAAAGAMVLKHLF
ncbi:MAG: sulfite exporter TauE/SafE family protein [Candidatus Eremiobacteraeota bacterium]|nr:sulfite exporter TauE/SafE family protein [Candidatus Eremiobacteraeota bacterium]